MNNTNVTVKDLAIKYQVSEQAIRAFCKAHNIRKEIVQLKQGKREIYCFDENALKLIHNHYSQESKATQASTTSKHNASDTTQVLIDSLREQISTLTAQLDIKDKQIAELTAVITNLSTAVNGAQTLHAADKPELTQKDKPIDIQAPAPSAPAPKQAPAEHTERERKAFSQQYGYSSSQYKNQPRKKGTYQASKLFGWMKKRS